MKYILIVALLTISACSSNPRVADSETAAEKNTDVQQEEKSRDRLEGFNRAMFAFNLKLDRWILKPAAKGYNAVLPVPVRVGVDNFFDNLSEVTNVFNDVLQWKWKQAGIDSSRFLINSTVGVGGIFDVAHKIGLKDTDGEDFGQTLAVWGVPQGSYIMLPFWGPSSFRALGGDVVNWTTSPETYIKDNQARWGLVGLEAVHVRSKTLAAEEIVSGDLYILVREAYLQRRDYLIRDGEVEDAFGDDMDEDFDDDWGDEGF